VDITAAHDALWLHQQADPPALMMLADDDMLEVSAITGFQENVSPDPPSRAAPGPSSTRTCTRLS
jgi:hypothetical protein